LRVSTETFERRIDDIACVSPRSEPGVRSLLDVFAASVATWGDCVAVDAGDTVLSYRELWDAAESLAARLRSLGIGPGDRVGVCVSSGTAELYVAILGVLVSGAAYVPVDAEDPPVRAEAVWLISEVCAVVEDRLAIAALADGAGGGLKLDPHDDAWVIFTSGSTGAPKGVAVTHRSAAAFVDSEARLWSVRPSDRVLAGLSVGFDASCEEMWLAWRNGAALVPAKRGLVRAGAEFGSWLCDHGVTVVSTVPTLAAMWDDTALAGVRLLILGGECCPEPLAWRLARGREVWNTYGPTEAAVVSTAARLRVGEPVTIGWPLDGWQVAVVDALGIPVAFGEAGELVIGGVGLGRYLDPELDAERFAAIVPLGWERAYRTGDFVRETIDGLEFVGRRDDQIKLGGRRIELGEVEAQLLAVPGVKASAAAVRDTASGSRVLVGYVVGDVEPRQVRAELAQRLADSIVPVIVVVDSIPTRTSGKADRAALPWPPPSSGGVATPGRDGCAQLDVTAAWLAERWVDQLGSQPIDADSDFFELGGNSLAVAKLVSILRSRFPAVAVADVYAHRRLGELAARLEQIGSVSEERTGAPAAPRVRWGAAQLAGILALFCVTAPQWIIGILAFTHWRHGPGPQVGWGWLLAGWLVFASAPGRAAIMLVARRVLAGHLRPGRYRRHGWLTARIWFLERLADVCHLDVLAGTPWAARYARISGVLLGSGVRLGTLPPLGGLVRVGDGASIEADVDLHGWWIEGNELVVGEIAIGAGASVGTRSVLMPGAEIGEGAEIDPGSVVTGIVPARERWAGSPARHIGAAGVDWPSISPPAPRHALFWKVMFGVGLGARSVMPIAAIVPGLLLQSLLGPGGKSLGSLVTTTIVAAPLIAASFLVTYGLLVALLVRLVARLVRPGWHAEVGATPWALWFTDLMMAGARGVLFPLYATVFTRSWLRLLGVKVGRRTEISTAAGLNRLVSFEDTSFAADDVAYAVARARNGWVSISPITVGSRTFLGNGAIVPAESRIGDDSLVGVLSIAPLMSGHGSSWFGAPAIELPRVPDQPDASRTTNPPARLIVGRGATELLRILLPGTTSVVLASLVYLALDTVGRRAGLGPMMVAAPFALLAAGLNAVLVTIAAKWLLMGRYRPGDHPLWSPFVWRDEIINTCQEQLAGPWLLHHALGTPLMSAYLRAMGSSVGSDVWCETLNVTEFDVVTLGDGAVINRHACLQTHLFHDRLMRIGPTTIGAGATLGPSTAVLPNTTIGAGATVGSRSVVMRGEELPPRTRWHGIPVVAG